MGTEDSGMDLSLDPAVPLFRHLAQVCSRAQAEGLSLRLVGGTAMLLWGKQLGRPREMTMDLDCALLHRDAPDEIAAMTLAMKVWTLLAGLGFTRNEDDWRASRKDRYCYRHTVDPVAVELLCGSLSVGHASRRKPAWKIVDSPTGPPDFYAAHVPWLDFVRSWIRVEARCGTLNFSAEIPDLAGMVVLKLRAVRDKIERVEHASGDQIEHEKLRLRRHGQDCAVLVDWIDEQGEYPTLFSLVRSHAVIGDIAKEAVRWLFAHDELVEELRLGGLDQRLERLLP